MHLDGIIPCGCNKKNKMTDDKQNGGQNTEHDLRKMDLETAVLLQVHNIVEITLLYRLCILKWYFFLLGNDVVT